MKPGFYIDDQDNLAVRYEDGSWDIWLPDLMIYCRLITAMDVYASMREFESLSTEKI